MSKIEDLIKQYCPNGCEWKSFYDVAAYVRGVSYSKSKDLGISGNGHKLLRANNIDVESNSLNLTDVKIVDYSVKVKKSQMLMADDILICAGSGSKEHIGKVSYIYEDMDYTFGGFMGVIRSDKKEIHPRYMFHILMSPLFRNYIKSSDSSTINNINNETWKNFQIPIPPRPVQEEIVRILDKFTELEKELEKELELRRKQYAFYRDKLLTFDGGVEWKRLGDVCQLVAGATPSKSVLAYWNNGTISWMSSGEVNLRIVRDTEKKITQLGYDSASTKIVPVHSVIIALAGQGKTRGKVAINEIELCTNQSLCSMICGESLNYKYLYYYLDSKYEELRAISNGDGNRGGLSLKILAPYKIPVPSPTEQERIVKILDKFDTLTTSLTSGLPAEIKLRKQQYEYYRDYLFGLLKCQFNMVNHHASI